MSTLAQRSFAAGEISPAMYARTDQIKYASGLRTCLNMMVQRHGGIASRAGTTFDGEVKDSTKVVRLVPFVFNTTQTYVLEFGNLYMRVHQNGGQVLEATKAVTGISQANPAVVTAVAHGYSTGDEIVISGVLGMVEMNGRNLLVTVLTANTFSVQTKDGVNLSSTAFTAYTSGGTVARVYTLVAPYAAADLALVKFEESADVITLTHPSYPIYELARSGNTNWSITAATLAPKTTQPDGGTSAAGGAAAVNARYRVTAVSSVTKEESLPGYESAKTITGATAANPVVVTAVAHGYTTGDEVYIAAIVGMTQLNGNKYSITKTGADTYSLQDASTGANIDGSAYTAYSSGGTSQRTFIACYASTTPTSAAPNVITIPGLANVILYNVYKNVNGVYGFIGSAAPNVGSVKYNDTGATPDTTDTPPAFVNPFPGANDYPSCVGLYQQRRIFGGTNNNPEQVNGSKTGSFKNFTTSTPSKADDAIQFTLAGRQVNAIKHLLGLGNLIAFTQAGEFGIFGDSSGAITPSSINAKQHSYCGASDLAPIVVDSTAIFVQARGSKVRDLAFDWQVNGYRGNDLSIFSTHLFEGYSLVDWTFAQIPNSIIWAVRSDGALIGLTYVREQQLWGWHRHNFEGGVAIVENVCAVPEGSEDYLYLVIKRVVNGRTVRYIERMATRQIGSIVDFIGMDCSLSFDGRNTDATKTMTLSGGTTWDYTDTLTLTANSAQFLSSDVGNAVFVTGTDGTLIRCKITAFTSTTVVSVTPVNKVVPVAMRSVALSTWAKALKTISGLFHLEGKQLSILGDGLVAASPNNSANTIVTVASGKATLDNYYTVIHAGLPVTCDTETLDPDMAQGETMTDKKKMVGKVTLAVWNSRGIFAGARSPESDPDNTGTDVLYGLEELKIRGENGESYDDPVSLSTGTVDIIVRPEWNNNGRVFIRQVDPIPLAILGIMPAGYFPSRG